MAAPYLNNQYINITPCQPKPGDAASWSQIDSRIKICPELHSKLHIYIYIPILFPSIHPSIHFQTQEKNIISYGASQRSHTRWHRRINASCAFNRLTKFVTLLCKSSTDHRHIRGLKISTQKKTWFSSGVYIYINIYVIHMYLYTLYTCIPWASMGLVYLPTFGWNLW